MQKYVYFFTLIIYLVHFGIASATIEPPRNPDSAKECAICHYRWVDTFFIDGRGSDLVDYQAEKVVATPEMCFTCHDGSVVDSRARVYNDHRHRVNAVPPQGMKIPAVFPLDSDGKMQCFTCHTAHGVPSEMGIEKTIFIRTSNDNSQMCVMCHGDKDGGINTGNHPVGSTEKKIPGALVSYGARVGDGVNQIICETCHTVHGSPYESFLIESAKNSHLCLECHAEKNIFTKKGVRNHNHVINVTPVRARIPGDIVKRGAKVGFKGELICQTCHKIHNNTYEKKLLLIMKDEESTLCLTCHENKKYVVDTKHNLIHSAPNEKNLAGKTVAEAGVCSACHLPHAEARKTGREGDFITRLCFSCHSKGDIAEKAIPADYRHPLDISPFTMDTLKAELAVEGIDKADFTLPLYNDYGIQDIKGFVTCMTCHDPHRWRSDSEAGEIREEVRGDQRTSFLREPSPDICKQCHGKKFAIENTKHDLVKVAPEVRNTIGQTPAESGVCGVCHLVHGGQQGYLWGRDIYTKSGSVVQDLCMGCHSDKGVANKKAVKEYSHPVNIYPHEKKLTTTLPLFDESGALVQQGLMTCQTCHDPHRWNPVTDVSEKNYDQEGTAQNSFLRMENYPSPTLCADCHKEEALVENTDHDLKITAPSAVNVLGQTPSVSGTCGVCHVVHNNPNPLKLWAQTIMPGASIMDRMCNSCHSKTGSARDKIPEIDSHPEGQLITNVGRDVKGQINYFPLYDTFTGELVTTGNISCASCHNVHHWDPQDYVKGKGINVEGSARNSFLRAQTYNLLCKDCHGLDALFRFKYYHDPEERREKRQNVFIPALIR